MQQGTETSASNSVSVIVICLVFFCCYILQLIYCYFAITDRFVKENGLEGTPITC